MKRLNLFLVMLGIFILSYVGLTFLLKWLDIYNIYFLSVLKFLCMIIIPILLLRWNQYISTFKYASITLIIIDGFVLLIELFSKNTSLFMLMHHIMPIPVILFLILTIMSNEKFVFGSRVTVFVSAICLILFLRFNGFLAMIMYAQDQDVIHGLLSVDDSLYLIMSIVIFVLNLLILDAVYDEKINNWK